MEKSDAPSSGHRSPGQPAGARPDNASELRRQRKFAEAAMILGASPPTLASSREWAIISYWLAQAAASPEEARRLKEEGAFHATVAELADSSDHPWAVANASWYAEKLPVKRAVSLVPKGVRPKFVPCNPSLLPAAGGGWWAMVRTVNWRQRGAVNYQVDPEFKGACLTTNFLLRLGPGLDVEWEVEIEDPGLVKRDGARPVRGMEDMRIYRRPNEAEQSEGSRAPEEPKPQEEAQALQPSEGLCASFTLLNNSRSKENGVRIGRVDLAPGGKASEVIELPSPTGSSCEKNWLPFDFRGRPCFFYGCDPITVVDEAGAIVHQRYCPFNCSSFRGSGGPIPYEGGYLVVIHECGFFPPGRVYFHRFVRYDARFDFLDVSRPFVFDNRGVEFCSSMVAAGDEFYLGCGIEDAEARVVVVTKETIESLWLRFSGRLDRYLSPAEN